MAQRNDIRTFFSRSVEDNMDALYGVALRLTRKQADAEDLVAEAVTKAWANIGTLNDRQRFRPWVFRILHNCFVSDYRKKSVRPEETPFEDEFTDEGENEIIPMLMDESVEFLKWWAEPEQTFFNDLLGQQIMSAIDKLPNAFRMTILLVNVEGLTYDEAADVLGVPPGTIRSRMKRGRTMLQKSLWRLAQEEGL